MSRYCRLLGGALNALAVGMTIFVILIHGTTGSATEASGLRGVVDILKVGRLCHAVGRRDVFDTGRREQLPQTLEAGLILHPALLGEFDGELDVQVAVVMVAIRRHALSANHLDGVWADGLARKDIDAQPPVVQMLDVKSTSCKSCDQLDLSLVEEIVLFTGKARVGLLLNLENDVACLDTRCLVALAAELDLGAASHALVDVDVEDLPVDNCLLSGTVLATILVVDDLALSVTVGAHCLESLDHGAHLAHHGLHAVAVAAIAALNCAFLSTATLALGAYDRALESKLGNLATVDVLEGDLVSVMDGAGLGRATVGSAAAAKHAAETTATTEELGEQVLSSHAAAASTAFKAGLAILIVNGALLRIGKDFIGVGDLLELLFGGRVVGVLVGMELQGAGLVRLLEFGIGCRRGDAEHVVELGLFNHLGGCLGGGGVSQEWKVCSEMYWSRPESAGGG